MGHLLTMTEDRPSTFATFNSLVVPGFFHHAEMLLARKICRGERLRSAFRPTYGST
jgi:hypothetical protein